MAYAMKNTLKILTGDLRLLGSRTLKGFGATIDARRKKLVAAGAQPAA